MTFPPVPTAQTSLAVVPHTPKRSTDPVSPTGAQFPGPAWPRRNMPPAPTANTAVLEALQRAFTSPVETPDSVSDVQVVPSVEWLMTVLVLPSAAPAVYRSAGPL